MHGAKKPPHLLHKRARGGEPVAPTMPGGINALDGFRHLEPQVISLLQNSILLRVAPLLYAYVVVRVPGIRVD